MTRGRAALVSVLAAYQTDISVSITQLVVQKLAYLLHVRGELPTLRFVKGAYGPYAENVNHALQAMDGHFLHGYGDRTTIANIEVDRNAAAEAAEFLAGEPEAEARVRAVEALIEGFESPFALELLATVHWAVHAGGAPNAAEAAKYIASWSERKSRLFRRWHVDVAWERLSALQWLDMAPARA